VSDNTTRILLKTTETVFSTPSYSHGSVAMSADGQYLLQQPTTYDNGQLQVLKGTPQTGYSAYGSVITPFNSNDWLLFDMSSDGNYFIITSYNGGNDGYKIYKNNGTSFQQDSTYSFIGAYTDSGRKPAFVPSNNNFAILGVQAVNNSTWYIKLYEYSSSTETWTGKNTITGPSLANSDHNLATFGSSFSYDGQYLLLTQDSAYDRLYILSVDWTNNTVTPVHTYSPSSLVPTAGALSPDNNYFVIFNHLGVYEVWENTSGDWSSVSNVTADFNLGEKFGSYGICWSGYDANNTTPLYIIEQGSLYADDLIRIEQWSRDPPQPPALTYDGITNLNITGAEANSHVSWVDYDSGKQLGCGVNETTYGLYRGGNYRALVSGATTYTITSNVLVPSTDILPMYRWPPPATIATNSLTESNTAGINSTWELEGASYGTGIYKAQANVAASSTSVTAYHAFDSNLTAGFENTSATTGTLTLQLPSAETIHKYVVWPKAADGKRPKSWTIEGSQDGNSWTTIHTVTDSPPSLLGDAHTITSPSAYVRYRINVTANAGGTGLEIAELALWGDVPFDITFNDGWTPASGVTTLTVGQNYTLPSYTTSAYGVTVTGTVNTSIAGTQDVVYTYVEETGLVKRVVRRFIVEYPTLAFHYGGFVATDYNSAYSTKEAAAAAGFIYADTQSFTDDPLFGSLTVVSNFKFTIRPTLNTHGHPSIRVWYRECSDGLGMRVVVVYNLTVVDIEYYKWWWWWCWWN
jgi:hypothetical protein